MTTESVAAGAAANADAGNTRQHAANGAERTNAAGTNTTGMTGARTNVDDGTTVSPGRVLLALICRFVLISLVFVVGFSAYRAANTPRPLDHMIALVNGLVWIPDVLAMALLVVLLRPEGRRLTDLIGSRRAAGLRPSAGREALTTVVTTLIVIVAFVVCTFVANLIVYRGAPPAGGDYLLPPTAIIWVQLLVMPITVAFAEELVYRGYALPRLVVLFKGNRWLAVVVQAFFFGLQHIAFFWGTPWQGALAKFLMTFLAGLVFGSLYLKQRRLLPLIIAHFVLDLVGFGLPAIMMLQG